MSRNEAVSLEFSVCWQAGRQAASGVTPAQAHLADDIGNSKMATTTNHRQADETSPGGGVDTLLRCPVCSNEFNAPKLLPCLHSFCFECLESSLAQSHIGPGQAFLCPLCKTQCVVPPRGVRAMKSNVFVVTLQEFFHNKTLDADQECETCDSGRAARKKCIECTDWMCNQCCAMHLKVGYCVDLAQSFSIS